MNQDPHSLALPPPLAVAGRARPFAQQKFITIGTGGVTGVYYAAGGAICRLMNKDRAKHGIRCSVESTGGSVFNINTIKAGELDFGVTQSDWQYHATTAGKVFEKDGKHSRPARRVLGAPRALHRAGAQGSQHHQVRGPQGQALQRRQPGLGHARLDGRADGRDGLEASDFSLASELKADEHGAALCDNKIDGFFYGVGHPAPTSRTRSPPAAPSWCR
jgi:uncharacterized protein